MLKSKTQDFKTVKITVKALLILPVTLYFLFFTLYLLCYAQQEQYKYDAKGKRDHFIPLVTADGRLLKLEPEEGVKGLLLEGIIYDNYSLSYAIVNGEIAKIGDKIGDYQVLKIEKNKVTFIKEGEITEIELKKEE